MRNKRGEKGTKDKMFAILSDPRIKVILFEEFLAILLTSKIIFVMYGLFIAVNNLLLNACQIVMININNSSNKYQ